MSPEERRETARDIAGILARGYDLHVDAHGPDGSAAVLTEDGLLYLVTQDQEGRAISYVDRGGERFAVTVVALEEAGR